MDDCWEFLVVGDPFIQLKSTVEQSASGEVVISKECWDLVKLDVEGEPRGSSDYLIKSILNPIPPKSMSLTNITVEMESALRCYIPKGLELQSFKNQPQTYPSQMKMDANCYFYQNVTYICVTRFIHNRSSSEVGFKSGSVDSRT